MKPIDKGPVAAAGPSVLAALQDALKTPQGLLDRLPIGIYACDADGVVVQYNRRAAELWGRAPQVGDTSVLYCGAFKAFQLDGAPVNFSDSLTAEVLRTAMPARDREVLVERPDGTRITILANAEPLLDPNGRLIGAVNCFQDISELKRAQHRQETSDRWFRDLLEALPAAVYTTDVDGNLTFYNEAAVEMWGVRPELGNSQWCGSWKIYTTDGVLLPHDQCPMAVALREGRPIRNVEAIAERPDGTRVPFMPFPTPLRDASGAVVGAVNMLVDISERKSAEIHQKALVDELNHRVKNTLATVQSLATQTLRRDDVPSDVRNAFEGRLFALSRTHNQLSNGGWRAARVRSIVDGIFAPHSGNDGRIRLTGGNVDVGPQTALILAMVIHELATNALKFGSLSTPQGTLDVTWNVVGGGDASKLEFEWTEAGGPQVAPPARRGFGSRLIERGVEQQLHGAAHLAFDPSGFRCRLEVPLSTRAA